MLPLRPGLPQPVSRPKALVFGEQSGNVLAKLRIVLHARTVESGEHLSPVIGNEALCHPLQQAGSHRVAEVFLRRRLAGGQRRKRRCLNQRENQHYATPKHACDCNQNSAPSSRGKGSTRKSCKRMFSTCSQRYNSRVARFITLDVTNSSPPFGRIVGLFLGGPV